MRRRPRHIHWAFLLIIASQLIRFSHSLLVEETDVVATKLHDVAATAKGNSDTNATSSRSNAISIGTMDKLDMRVGAVLIKVAYGTTSTTKRSIPDSSYALALTTVATPLLTTQRYQSSHQQQSNGGSASGGRHRNYELDLERDHALPTSAPNADILKSNNNPTYPNPNRHHSHDRDRHRHPMQYNSTPMPSIPNLLKKTNGQAPTIPMYPGDIPSYSPPSRSFFTPPLPPEYQNPFADKPTLRGTNNEGGAGGGLMANTGTYINRRPIPPPSLMPGHERIPYRPPDLAGAGANDPSVMANVSYVNGVGGDTKNPIVSTSTQGAASASDLERKKALNTPARPSSPYGNDDYANSSSEQQRTHLSGKDPGKDTKKRQEVLPNIRRILGSNGKGDIPAVLLKQVTQRPLTNYHHPPSSPIVLIENGTSAAATGSERRPSPTERESDDVGAPSSAASPNINQSKHTPGGQDDLNHAVAAYGGQNISHYHQSTSSVTTPAAAAAIGDVAATSYSYATTNHNQARPTSSMGVPATGSAETTTSGTGSGASVAAAASAHTTWTWAWNVHIYLSVVLFTILSVYSLYKLLTYNKLTHLFAQSYFVCIHLILIVICIMRISYLCFDAYNIHGTFHIFAAELLLNLPATFLTVAFAVLMLYLFLKSLNHKNNRYSALIRPLTVIVGCGVHIVLCITLHYVESYTLQNHHLYYQQQHQHQYFRRQQQSPSQPSQPSQQSGQTASVSGPPPPPRVLTLICQIIYIFICLILGLLYLYLYRILKRILRSKSQNYIHGYQNLSYAIHITIATALLFVLMAALQIFGAICISSARPLISQATIVEIDWLQWGYQFSLRLIEIAIITLISWVTGLKTSVGHNASGHVGGVGPAASSDLRLGMGSYGQSSGGSGAPGSGNGIPREKPGAGGGHHNFFLPCTSSSSQEQFETDYPAICNTNTNLHTYTMRTGKLIYDDSYALNPLGQTTTAVTAGTPSEFQLQEPMYQRPYDTGSGSIRSAVNHNIADYSSQSTQSQRYPHPHHMRLHEQGAYMSTDYMTDATTDHYENPNFDLRTSSTGMGTGPGAGTMQKLNKNLHTASSSTALSSGASASGSGSGSASGSSGTSQQQMLLLQSDSCYSEPMHQENSSYEFNNFERPTFKEKTLNQGPLSNDECWPGDIRHKLTKSRDRKHNNNNSHTRTLERAGFENPERRSSNSTNSCSSSNGGGGGGRYASYNTCERGYFNGVRKSGTLNSIANGSGAGGGPGRAIPVPISASAGGQRLVGNGVQTLGISDRDRAHYYQRSAGGRNVRSNDLALFSRETVNCVPPSLNHKQQQHQQQPYTHDAENEDEEEPRTDHDDDDEDDDMISGSNVECTNLISNENGPCIPNEGNGNALIASVIGHSPHPQSQSHPHSTHHHLHVQNNTAASSSTSAAASVSSNSASDSMLVTEQGFLRFRALEDPNSTPTIPGAAASLSSVRHQSRNATINGIDC
ncbi:uncharacterized protein Dwil_GK13609 [Drosophila willistoni]|uniref:Proline-rich transmembrane protein 3/4 domain-containing protein n=1 Tax=Drosophila willistoni TaxID=7260 RepID=B4NHK0_DROWI|nr:uncharacterized protein LOC6650796 [Drosophila willistoni]EDW83569.1 uncharacterized protein Dwil_GK13609 [Drosophila willistoni]